MNKRIVYITLIILSMFVLSGCFTSYEDDDITAIKIMNITDINFIYLRIRETGDTSWLFSRHDDFNNVDSHEIDFLFTPLKIDKRYDIQLATLLGTTATKYSVSLKQNNTVMFEQKDIDDNAGHEITSIHILNDTGISFDNVMIGETGSQSWIWTINQEIPNGTTSNVRDISKPLSTTVLYEIRLLSRSSGNITATKTNVTLSQNRTIIFESSDLD